MASRCNQQYAIARSALAALPARRLRADHAPEDPAAQASARYGRAGAGRGGCAAIQQALQGTSDLAAGVSGSPPLPAKPDTGYIQALQAYSGNERLMHVYEVRDRLRGDYSAWKALLDRKATRQERWAMLQSLLKHAAKLPAAAVIQTRAEAIVVQRLLLDAVDPVKPLLDALTGALREALQQGREQVEAAREEELAAIRKTEEWNKLDDQTWRRLFRDHHLDRLVL